MTTQEILEQDQNEQQKNKTLWKHKNFLRLWAGQSVSLMGSQITQLALPLTAVITLHATAFQMGILQATTSVPVLLLGLFAGVWIDRMRRRPLLVFVDLGRAVLLGSIPLAAYFHYLRIEYLYGVTFFVGILTLFFDVAHMSLLPSLVSREQIVEGNSKLEISRSGAWIVGPGLAGLLIQLLTAPISIIVDALSFVWSAWFIARIRTTERVTSQHKDRRSFWADLREGLHIVWSNQILRAIALSTATYNFFASMVSAVYILYVTRDLNLSPATLGFIFAIGSVGFPFGAMLAGAASKRFGLGSSIIWAAVISDAAFLLILFTNRSLLISIPLLIAAKIFSTFAGPITAINQLSLRQAITSDRLQGRVNGTMRFIVQCMNPVGALLAGTLGSILGIWPTLCIGAIGIQLGFVILLFSSVRHYKTPPQEKDSSLAN